MGSAHVAKVTHRGQMSLPASTRHRWGLDSGGKVEIVDIGSALVLFPHGEGIREDLAAAMRDGRYEAAVAAIDDPDLATE